LIWNVPSKNLNNKPEASIVSFFKPQQTLFNYDREACRGQASSDRIEVNYPQENSLTFESEEMSCILLEKIVFECIVIFSK
jgi:hypothetical protein